MISYLSMAMRCANCGKGVAYGHEVSHAKNRTKRLFLPNLHFARVILEGKIRRMRLCTKCMRKVKRETVEKKSSLSTSSVPATA